jgi:hypothetical protein
MPAQPKRAPSRQAIAKTQRSSRRASSARLILLYHASKGSNACAHARVSLASARKPIQPIFGAHPVSCGALRFKGRFGGSPRLSTRCHAARFASREGSVEAPALAPGVAWGASFQAKVRGKSPPQDPVSCGELRFKGRFGGSPRFSARCRVGRFVSSEGSVEVAALAPGVMWRASFQREARWKPPALAGGTSSNSNGALALGLSMPLNRLRFNRLVIGVIPSGVSRAFAVARSAGTRSRGISLRC